MTPTRALLLEMLAARLAGPALEAFRAQVLEVGGGVTNGRFAALLSRASRFAPRESLRPGAEESARAAEALPGWSAERWLVLEAWRVLLVLARPDLAEASAQAAIEESFRYADEGEARALYRAIAHLPGPERFTWRAGEGCRTNIVPVFEAVACDTPYPFLYFDDIAWRQLAIKAVFIGAPLWRVHGLDQRLSPELARMALDLVDERRSAGREVPHELWLCLGPHAGERGLASIERELEAASGPGRRAALFALARAGGRARLEDLLASSLDRALQDEVRAALADSSQAAFRALDPRASLAARPA